MDGLGPCARTVGRIQAAGRGGDGPDDLRAGPGPVGTHLDAFKADTGGVILGVAACPSGQTDSVTPRPSRRACLPEVRLVRHAT